MKEDLLQEKKVTISLRNVLDIGVILSIGYLGFTVNTLKGEMDSIVSLIEATSEEATKKIQEMDVNYSVSSPKLTARRDAYDNVTYNVGQVGALRVTERIKRAFGKNIKIVVKPDPSNSFYIAEIGSQQFVVSADGEYLIIDDVYVPLDENEYQQFKQSEDFIKLQNKDVTVSSVPVSNGASINQISDPEKSKAPVKEIEDKLSKYYPEKIPGLNISLNTYQERLDVFEKAKTQAIQFEAINPVNELFVFFDVSCPSCKKFFESIPVYQEKGITINLMLIDKSRKYTSSKAKEMMSIYCEADRKSSLISLLNNKYDVKDDCGYGKQYLESMTNSALLVGTIGTPSVFTSDGIPVYEFDERKGKYYPIYKYSSVTNWFEKNGPM